MLVLSRRWALSKESYAPISRRLERNSVSIRNKNAFYGKKSANSLKKSKKRLDFYLVLWYPIYNGNGKGSPQNDPLAKLE